MDNRLDARIPKENLLSLKREKELQILAQAVRQKPRDARNFFFSFRLVIKKMIKNKKSACILF